MAFASVLEDKKLILNADDFGLHESINEAIERAHRHGILKSASLVANGDGFEHAVDIAKRNARLGVGIHLVFTEERPIASIEKISSIVARDGRLFKSYINLCVKILKRKVDLDHIAIECEAQIDKFIKSGLVPTHLDSHQHLHLFPPIFKTIDSILKKYGIKKIRALEVPWFDYQKGSIFKVGFALFVRCSKLMKNTEYKKPDYFLGFFRNGCLDIAYLKNVLPRLKNGVTEIAFHPGVHNNLIMKRYGFWKDLHRWKCDWEAEYSLLINPEIKKAINSNRIALINYADM